MIQITNLKKVFNYGDVYTVALGGINLAVNKGEFVAIMGPSGCGKTTLLNIMGLLDNPTEGSYELNGVEVADMKESRRTTLRKGKIGFIFQSFNHFPPGQALPEPALGRPAAARSHRPRRGV